MNKASSQHFPIGTEENHSKRAGVREDSSSRMLPDMTRVGTTYLQDCGVPSIIIIIINLLINS
jgi:hypothetical protein